MKQDCTSVDMRDKNDQSPLYVAVESGNIRIVRLLMSKSKVGVHSLNDLPPRKGLEISIWTPLFVGWLEGSLEMMRLLLQCPKIDTELRDQHGCHLLHQISYGTTLKERISPVELLQQKTGLLIKSGKFPVNEKSKHGYTPVALAAGIGALENLKALLDDPKVDISIKADDGLSPCMLAVCQGHENVVQWLIDNERLAYDDRSPRGDNLVHMAVGYGQPGVAKVLLETDRFDVTTKNSFGATLLHEAVHQGIAEVVQVLLDNVRIDPNIDSEYHLISLASHLGHTVIAQDISEL